MRDCVYVCAHTYVYGGSGGGKAGKIHHHKMCKEIITKHWEYE